MSGPKFYTGVGSRETPSEVLQVMTDLAYALASEDWVMRSGGADGADTAFLDGVEQWVDMSGLRSRLFAEVYLPWDRFNQGKHNRRSPGVDWYHEATAEAVEISARVWDGWGQRPKNWDDLTFPTKALMSRNVHQVIGPACNCPSTMVVCWTPDGVNVGEDTSHETGGTGHAIRVASMYPTKVYNLKDPVTMDRILTFIEKSRA